MIDPGTLVAVLFLTAAVLLVTSIVTFIFPRVIISFMEFCEQTITEFDDRRRRR